MVVNENKPDDIREIMKQDGFNSSVSASKNMVPVCELPDRIACISNVVDVSMVQVVKTRLAGREKLFILKFVRASS